MIEEKKDEVVEEVTDGEVVETSSTEEVVSSEEKTTEEVVEESAQEKKFTDDDMKKAREGYQKETRQERDARIAAETKAEVLKEMLEGKKTDVVVQEPKPIEIQKPIRPKESNHGTREEYDAAMDKYEDDRDAWRESLRVQSQASTTEKEKAANTEKELRSTIQTQAARGREAYTDYDIVVWNNKSLAISPLMALAISKLKNAPDVNYHLGKNIDESRRLFNIKDPIELVAELGAISADLKKSPSTIVKKAITKAPAPGATVAAKSSTTSKNTELAGKTPEERRALIEDAARKRRLKVVQ